MNLHPVFVHFPIALLIVYSLMELVPFKKITNQPYWFYLKAVFVMLGGLGALAAWYTGDMAKLTVRQGTFNVVVSNFKQVVAMHQNFADLSVAIFGIIAASYLAAWINRDWPAARQSQNALWKFLTSFSSLILKRWLVVILALIGLVCITITGGLGGVMVYGPAADPFFGVIYKLLFP